MLGFGVLAATACFLTFCTFRYSTLPVPTFSPTFFSTYMVVRTRRKFCWVGWVFYAPSKIELLGVSGLG